MKSPLWIITSLLAIILMAFFAFILYSMKSLFVTPAPAFKITVLPSLAKKEERAPRDVSVIYEEHDLFSTYRQPIQPIKPVDILPAIPAPPPPIPVRPKPSHVAQFLKPLPLKISGIIESTNEMKSQVSFVNTNTGKTESFKVGDKVLDAYILRILPKKVLVVRSNGQQETIYIYSNETREDTNKIQDTSWSDVIQQQSNAHFLINPATFKSRIHSLADLVEMLDLTTASRGGIPLGMRIGSMKKTSIGFAGGLKPGDIITKIMNTPPISTTSRKAIFNALASMELGSEITLQFIRNNNVFTHTYTLFNLADPTATLEIEERSIKKQRTQIPLIDNAERAKAPINQRPSIPPSAPQAKERDEKKRDLEGMKRYGNKPADMPNLRPIGSSS